MRLMLALSLLATTASSAIAGDNVMLVLDASGSMWGQIEGRSKVEIARETVAGVSSAAGTRITRSVWLPMVIDARAIAAISKP